MEWASRCVDHCIAGPARGTGPRCCKKVGKDRFSISGFDSLWDGRPRRPYRSSDGSARGNGRGHLGRARAVTMTVSPGRLAAHASARRERKPIVRRWRGRAMVHGRRRRDRRGDRRRLRGLAEILPRSRGRRRNAGGRVLTARSTRRASATSPTVRRRLTVERRWRSSTTLVSVRSECWPSPARSSCA